MSLTRRSASIALLSAFARPAAAQDAAWQSVVDAAKKEGVVVVYNAGLGVQVYNEIVKTFIAKYGIRVDTINARGSEMTERIRTEHAGGRYVGDVECHSASNLAQQTTAGGFLQPHGGVPNAANLRPPFVATAKIGRAHV